MRHQSIKAGNPYLSLLVLLSVLRPVFSSAWWPESILFSLRTPVALRSPAGPFSSAVRKFRPTELKSSQEASDVAAPPDVDAKRLIEITSEVKLPFSREVAFDAYSDLRRQPSWSSWLHSVEYTDDAKASSKWTMKFMGVKYSWTAVALRNERPDVIQWQSTSGLQNFGVVNFLPRDDAEHPTLMTMRMTFVAPRAAAAVFRRSKAMANFVKDKMITESMVSFRDAISNSDLKEKQ